MTPNSAEREPLSRERIVAAAMELIDSDGVDQLSMRRLGRHLGVDPMAVYYHVPSKAAVLDDVVELIWGSVRIPPPAPGETWRDLLVDIFTDVRARLLGHPRAAVVLGTRPATTPSMLALIDTILGRLALAGLEGVDAMELIDCLSGFTVGKVLAETGEALGGATSAVADALAGLSPATHPNLVAVLAGGYVFAPDEEFRRGLRALVDGWR